MKAIDLSGTIENNLWTYGLPNPEVKINEIANIDDDGAFISSLEMSILTGSYVETGRHLIKGHPTLDEIPVERFISRATVLKLAKGPLEPITKNDLKEHKSSICKNNTLIIGTGWDQYWNSDIYLKESPHFTVDAIKWLVETPVNLLGADIPFYNDPRKDDLKVLKIYYEDRDNMIVAPLININKIPKSEIKLIATPLKLKDQCAAPARVIAIL